MKSFISKFFVRCVRDRMLVVSILILSGVLVAGAVSAATTISTDINTGGQLTVTGTSTLLGIVSIGSSTPASNTMFSVGTSSPLFFIDNNTGYAGFGTTSPGYKMTLSSSEGLAPLNNNAQLYISHTAASAYPYAGIQLDHFNSASGNQGGSFISFSDNNVSQSTIQVDTAGGGTSGTDVNLRILNDTGTTGSIVFGTNANTERMRITGVGSVGIEVASPTASLEVATSTSNATTTIVIGKSGQNKGSCLVLYDAAGTAVYAYVAAGASTFTLSATSCK